MQKVDSEKKLEQLLRSSVEERGGICLKLLTNFLTGLPDRLCLFPEGIAFFVEVKTTGKKPREIQKWWHNRLRNMGFGVYVLDQEEQLTDILNNYNPQTK